MFRSWELTFADGEVAQIDSGCDTHALGKADRKVVAMGYSSKGPPGLGVRQACTRRRCLAQDSVLPAMA
ncbi:hypothetical protein MRX96_015770 [Rhipicephalus microplus]